MRLLSFLLPVALLSANVMAANAWFTSTVKRIYPTADGSWILVFTDPDPGCTDASGYHYVKVGQNSVTADGSKEMLSVALTAGTTGNKISAYYDQADPNCNINRLYIRFGE